MYSVRMGKFVTIASVMLLLQACRQPFNPGSDSATDTDVGTSTGSSDDSGSTSTTGDETDSGTDTDETGSTGDGDGDGDVPLDLPDEPSPEGEPCDPLDQADPCVGDFTCSLYEWDAVGNYFEFICMEYTGEMDGGGFADPVGGGGWGECKSGFMPLNNIGLANFPDGLCLGAGNGGTCCTTICSDIDPICPAAMTCSLFLEPMNPEIYSALQYGNCRRL